VQCGEGPHHGSGGARLLHRAAIVSTLQFYVPFFGFFNNFLLAMKKGAYLLGSNMERAVTNISLLSEYGLSALDISKKGLSVSNARMNSCVMECRRSHRRVKGGGLAALRYPALIS
jgi:hypothetical protein